MQIILNSNSSLDASQRMSDWVSREMEQALAHFADRITRVEVHLNDINSSKGGAMDKYCSIEARLKGLNPMAVNHEAPSFDLALAGAAEKLETLLQRSLGKMEQKKGRTPMGGEPYAGYREPDDEADLT